MYRKQFHTYLLMLGFEYIRPKKILKHKTHGIQVTHLYPKRVAVYYRDAKASNFNTCYFNYKDILKAIINKIKEYQDNDLEQKLVDTIRKVAGEIFMNDEDLLKDILLESSCNAHGKCANNLFGKRIRFNKTQDNQITFVSDIIK